MSIRVNQPQVPQTQTGELSRSEKLERSSKSDAARKTGDAAAAIGSSIGAAKAEISTKGKDFAKAREVAAKAPDVREDRVSDLKERIASGKYKVSADAIADRMVDEHLRMGGA